ncbi:hypothetical protein KC19_9G145400 [Ceratodon purpureus]|uniref:Uncharacterized protein n=1 Tax=Ceratodon purpureus TaxID=3225 RepID=A0A8T0GTU3_CERPU|nr:hypothetical protein KC19_9G145400 [Ceratodon purpureus]
MHERNCFCILVTHPYDVHYGRLLVPVAWSLWLMNFSPRRFCCTKKRYLIQKHKSLHSISSLGHCRELESLVLKIEIL